MEDYSDHIAIVFPVTTEISTDLDLNDPPEAHCTLIYLGTVSDASYTKEDVQSVLDRMKIKAPGEVTTSDLALFGPGEDVLVLTLDSSKLDPIRVSIERGLAKIGAKNGSEYKTYNPHVTIDSKTSATLNEAEESVQIPPSVTLEAPVLWWGDEH